MKTVQKNSRQKRVRAKVVGKQMPRLSVFRSNKYIYAQIIDDIKGKTILGISEKEISLKESSKTARASELGKILAKKALSKKISEVVFDRGSYKYHGRVKEFAQGAREGGLKF